jgi:hypothetical protein
MNFIFCRCVHLLSFPWDVIIFISTPGLSNNHRVDHMVIRMHHDLNIQTPPYSLSGRIELLLQSGFSVSILPLSS